MARVWRVGGYVRHGVHWRKPVGKIVRLGKRHAIVLWQDAAGAIFFGNRMTIEPLSRLRRPKVLYDARDDKRVDIREAPIVVIILNRGGIEILYFTLPMYRRSVRRNLER